MAEEGRFAIDNFLVYRRDPAKDDLVRLPLHHAVYEFEGKRSRLAWVDMSYSLFPVIAAAAGEGVTDVPMIEVCASGDIGFVPWTGHFHPNKPPGTSLLALPAYWLIFHAERWLGFQPDHWWTLTLNVWLSTVLSVGLISAIGCVFFFRLAREFAHGAAAPAALATIAFAFGTTFFPFGTILFDHNLTASLLIASFYFIRASTRLFEHSGRAVNPVEYGRGAAFLAGLCAGFAAITNYIAAVAVVMLGMYLLLARSRRAEAGRVRFAAFDFRPAFLYALGVLGPFLLICWYGWTCFGSPFRLSTDFQNPLFKDPGGALGMFAMPSGYAASLLLISPYRGVFFLAPVLICGIGGLLIWMREKTWVAEARLCLAVFGFFFLVNASFNGYHGGFSAGPRYLVPGIPFLALPLVIAFVRWKKVALALLAASIAQQFLLTATDAQNPLAVGGHARLDDAHRKDDFFCNLVTEYAWPLFATGRAGGLLDQLLEARLDQLGQSIEETADDDAGRESQLAAMRAKWRASIEHREPSPFLLAAIRGPVSVNPVGVYDGLLGMGNFDIGAPQSMWASCNLGEFLWPQSRWSLLPLVIVSGGLSVAFVSLARRH